VSDDPLWVAFDNGCEGRFCAAMAAANPQRHTRLILRRRVSHGLW